MLPTALKKVLYLGIIIMETKQSLHARVMKLAWKIYKNRRKSLFSVGEMTFGECLSSAWTMFKKVNPHTYLKNIFQNLTFVQIKNTKDYHKICNARPVRKSEDEDVRELVDSGLIPLGDIMKYRRRVKSNCNFTPRQEEELPTRTKRPRVKYNPEKACIKL